VPEELREVGGHKGMKATGPLGITILVLALVLVSCQKERAMREYTYEGRAMSPTLRSGDRLLVSTQKVALKRGDIVVFVAPGMEHSNRSVGRVVAIGQDVIDSARGRLLVNSQEVMYSTLQTNIFPATGLFRTSHDSTLKRPLIFQTPILVPTGCVFLVGDNPSESFDSRYWGPLPITSVVGSIGGQRMGRGVMSQDLPIRQAGSVTNE